MRRNALLESKCTALFNRVRLPIVGVYERPPFRTQSRRPFNRRKRTDQRLFLNGDQRRVATGNITRGSPRADFIYLEHGVILIKITSNIHPIRNNNEFSSQLFFRINLHPRYKTWFRCFNIRIFILIFFVFVCRFEVKRK